MNRILRRLDVTHNKLIASINVLDEESFCRRVSPEAWSVAEVVHHLCLVEERVVKDLRKALSKPPRNLPLLRRLIPTAIVAYRLIRVKAPQAVTPTDTPPRVEVIESYNAARSALKEICLNEGRERLSRAIFKHPFLGEISGIATVSFVGYHEQRHHKQIREIIGKLNSVHK